jgi:hypothetical protein
MVFYLGVVDGVARRPWTVLAGSTQVHIKVVESPPQQLTSPASRYHVVMSRTEAPIWDAERGDRILIESPDIGEVTVLFSEPRERTRLQDGRNHLVFVRSSGRMVGMNTSGDIDIDRCILVEDEDGFQHAVVRGAESGASLFTRRPPGEPDDWERRQGFETNAVVESSN